LVADVTFIRKSSFQSLSVPLRLSRNGDSPKYATFPEAMKVYIHGIWDTLILVEVPATTFTSRQPGEVHFWRRDILNHRIKTDQGSVPMRIRRIVQREWGNLSAKPKR
jgi:hypothetical protein